MAETKRGGNMLYYNENVKEKYMASMNALHMNTSKEYFKLTAEYENEKGKDIALFDADEWFDFLKVTGYITISKVYYFTTFIAKYAKWYFDRYAPKQENHFEKISNDKMIEYTTNVVNNNRFISRELLLQLLKEIDNAVDRFMILCLYEGIRGEEFNDIMLLKLSDVDFENNIFHLPSGEDAVVSDELLEAAKQANAQKNFATPVSPFAERSAGVGSFNNEAETIFKFRDNARTKTPNAKRIYNRFNVYRDYFENDDFNSLRIINSGLAHQFREIKRKYNTNDHVAVYHVPEMKALMQKYGFAEDYARFAYRKLTKAGYNLDIDI